MTDNEQKGNILHRVEEEVNEEIHPLLQKIHDNVKLIGLVLGSVVLIAAGVTGYKYFKQTRLQNAKSTMSSLLTQNQGQELITALEGFLPEAPEAVKQAVRLELAKQSMEQESYEAAATYWQQAAQGSSDPNLRTVAGLGQAKALRFAGQPEQSLQLLESLQSEAPAEYERTLLYEVAVTAEAAGQWQRALTAYEELHSMAELTSKRGNFIEYKIGMLQNMLAAGNS
jgi:predicted negative regulator of RcsB-dependent stress response